MNAPHHIFSVMTIPPLEVSVREAEAVARERWGIAAQATELRGERDRNFHLAAADGREFVLKFANPVEDADFREMQIAALEHIARGETGLLVPRVVALPGGAVQADVRHSTGAVQQVRLLTWVPGELLREVPRSAAQRIACGRALARLQLVLRDFTHRARDHQVVWDLQHAAWLRDIAFAIPMAAGRDRLRELLDEFAARVAPVMPGLRRQVLHNDLNDLNTLVDPVDHDRIVGVIDFGDLAETAVVFDVAIAAVTQMRPDISAGEALGHFVGGFHAIRPLLAEEVALLPLLIAVRIGMGMALSSWHRHSQPDNPHFEVTAETIGRRLAAIDAVRSPAVDRTVRRACGLT